VVPGASLERAEHGLRPVSDGWFVVNVRDTRWFEVEGGDRFTVLDSEEAAQLGFRHRHPAPRRAELHVPRRGDAGGLPRPLGRCLLIVEGEERPLKAWDFVHSPPWTEHVFVGAGDGPCVVVGVGARRKGKGLRYPVNETALKHAAGVEEETSDPSVAYASFPEAEEVPCPDDFPPW
jgi:hypothetical protein